jgi:DNA processing protein
VTLTPRSIVRGDPLFPTTLTELRVPPRELFALGNIDLLSEPLVAIVGTREASPYGTRAARTLASALARAGACVVSGLARGIDTAAHEGALDARGSTIAVLGSGVDIPYPASNRKLYERITRHGLVLSEMPCGARPHKGSFPNRNRIIAALARATIIVEAGQHSGAKITANHALELNRSVAAVPGPIDDERHAGSNELLRDGAVVIANPDDALALMQLRQLGADGPSLQGDELLVWSSLGAAGDLDSVAVRSGIPLRRCLAAVTSLELAGLVESTVTGEFRRRE